MEPEAIYTRKEPTEEEKEIKYSKFRKELEDLINCNSMENGCDTPDWILSEYLVECLKTFDKITKIRSKYYDQK